MSQGFLHCLVRKFSVASTPEEMIRQSLLSLMVNRLGYPLETLVVERGLDQMPHLNLNSRQIPSRRADIVCFAKGIHPKHSLYPLLLIECKSVKLDAKAKNQVIGYNRYLQSLFISLANAEGVQTGRFNPSMNGYEFINGLPRYADLVNSCLF
ncbi:type I restriction enzyme HsdR N-terminal domain-containing protein [Waddlia chondrophila]|nr:type I restriction enzyme HsdR N-terminal domain-containing protein [Waddlia chondrophila]